MTLIGRFRNKYKSRLWFRIFFWTLISSILISLFFLIINFILNKPLYDDILNISEDTNRKIINLDTNCIDKIENLTNLIDKFDVFDANCPKAIQQDDKLCYSNVTFIDSPEGKAILIDNCDVRILGPINIKTNVGHIRTKINPRWEDKNKHILVSLSDKLVLFVENDILKFTIIELDGTEHTITSNVSNYWDNENWYDMAAEWNIDSGEITLYGIGNKLSQSTIKNLNVQMKNLMIYEGSNSEGNFQANAAFEFIGIAEKSVEELLS